MFIQAQKRFLSTSVSSQLITRCPAHMRHTQAKLLAGYLPVPIVPQSPPNDIFIKQTHLCHKVTERRAWMFRADFV